jgi:Flp pilus assembly protein TadD
MFRALYVALCCVVLAAPATAQLKAPTKRPKLNVDADTNDARQYYSYGLQQLERDPQTAADAFYWAARINPGWADALYARRVALLLRQPNILQRYWFGDSRTLRSKEVRQIDSLWYQALTQNPFLYEKLDRAIYDAWVKKWAEDYVGPGNSGAMEVQYQLQNYLRQLDPELRAYLAYYDGRFDDALKLWADATKRAKYKAYYRVLRGKLFFQTGNVDSAYTEFALALDEMRKRDKKDLVYVYESKALVEQAIGMIHERHDSLAAARDAYGRALQEDLSYYPAHVHLGYVALALKDTATALNEMDLAVQIRADDPMLHYVYGYSLGSAHKYTECEAQLKKAAELEPLFALPHAALGEFYEQQNKPQDALKAYREYLARAARTDTRRENIQARVTALSAVSTSGALQ